MKIGLSVLTLGVLAATALVACGGGSPAPAANNTQAVTLNFDVVNGASAVGASGCGTPQYLGNAPASGVAPAGTKVNVQDLRYYVSNVALIDAAGSATPVTLTENNWQGQNVALLDFENAQGSCSINNSVATNTAISGTVPQGNYVGVSFTVGVPETLNHSDWASTLTPLPLQNAALAWSWQSGRKFSKIEVTIPAVPATATASAIPAVTTMVHLGATGCTPVAGALPNTAFTCTDPNRMNVKFASGYNAATNKIAFDIGALFSGLNLSTSHTWMSGKTGMMAADAPYYFGKYNLSYASAVPSGQPQGTPQTLFVIK